MTNADLTAQLISEAPIASRKWAVMGGRLLLAVLLLLGWELGARTLGSVFFASPLDVVVRIGKLAESGQLLADVASTLRVSALGFAIACVAGVLLPFLLRRLPRVSEAVEPYIMASMGIPKYALAPWLILWFGIGDLPKLVVVTLMVFYIVFITTTAGIRAVDQRLINMARVAGAGEAVIAREIVFKSLLPFFFTGLKVALPRAGSPRSENTPTALSPTTSSPTSVCCRSSRTRKRFCVPASTTVHTRPKPGASCRSSRACSSVSPIRSSATRAR